MKGAVAGGISVSSGHGLAPVPYARQHRARFRPGVAASGVLFVFSRELFVIQSFTCRRHCRSIRLYLRASANSDVSPLPVARAYPGSSLVGGDRRCLVYRSFSIHTSESMCLCACLSSLCTATVFSGWRVAVHEYIFRLLLTISLERNIIFIMRPCTFLTVKTVFCRGISQRHRSRLRARCMGAMVINIARL